MLSICPEHLDRNAMTSPCGTAQRKLRLPGTLLLATLALAAESKAETVRFDLDGDGRAEFELELTNHQPGGTPPDGVPGDRNEDGTIDFGLEPGPEAAVGTGDEFEKVYDTGAVLSVLWTVEAGDADLDGLFDFAGGRFNPNTMHLFESDGNGSYTETWVSSEATPPGAYRDIVFADTDQDGRGEILGGEVSTLGKVMLFEQESVGGTFQFLHDTVRESDPSGGSSIRRVLVGDTDLDGRQEIIVIKGGSSPTTGSVAIWEHNGVVGTNSYTRVFEYETVSYIFDAGFGDTDNDDYPEIILGLGGFGGNPLIIRRLEYDPGLATWVHHQFTSSVIGLPLTPHVVDFDGDGEMELTYGSSGFAVVYENTAENVYAPRFISTEVLSGNLLGMASHSMSGFNSPGLAGGSFDGDLSVWVYDTELDDMVQVFESLAIGGAIRRLEFEDDGEDGREELLPALAGGVNRIDVWRRTNDPASVDPGVRGHGPELRLAPNPAVDFVRIAAPRNIGRISILDVNGREVVAMTVEEGNALWKGTDSSGRRVPAGVYWVRGVSADGVLLPAKTLVLTR